MNYVFGEILNKQMETTSKIKIIVDIIKTKEIISKADQETECIFVKNYFYIVR